MPNKQQWNTIKLRLREIFEVLRRINPITKERIITAVHFVRKSWKSIAVIVPLFLILYYLIGSWATNNIDKSLVSVVKKPEKGLTLIVKISDLIGREVDDKMWTPNLPVIFPGYFLDNMPSFQSGIISSLRVVVGELSHTYDSQELNKAAELLKYPPDIWLLSKTEGLALAPSSGAQYRRARKSLIKFNDEDAKALVTPDVVLSKLLSAVGKNLGTLEADIDKQVREHGDDWTDNQADNVFYYAQGSLYGYYVVLKALGEDFKDLILQSGQYENLTALNKTLENGFLLSPTVVRNGNPEAVFAPNHLLTLNYYIAKARYQLEKLITALATVSLSGEANAD